MPNRALCVCHVRIMLPEAEGHCCDYVQDCRLCGDISSAMLISRSHIYQAQSHLLKLYLLQATESELGDVDLSGLPEAAVDSEEEEEEDEDLERASDTLLGRDLVRECLEKDPVDRNDDDIGQFNSSLTLLLSVFGETLVLFLACLHVRH